MEKNIGHWLAGQGPIEAHLFVLWMIVRELVIKGSGRSMHKGKWLVGRCVLFNNAQFCYVRQCSTNCEPVRQTASSFLPETRGAESFGRQFPNHRQTLPRILSKDGVQYWNSSVDRGINFRPIILSL